MKRHFLAGFMAFCVGAMSLSTVSCGKLEDGLNELNEKVEKLEERIKNLEDKLTAQADAITKLEAKVAVVGVEKKDGNVILTLANGEKVTVAVPDPNANNTNLVTIIVENGKKYWATIGEDGKATSLDIEVGAKLKFKVDPETKELFVSYDGNNYEPTGVLVKNPDEYAHIVTGFEEGEDYVKVTVGEVVYTLPKYVEDNASLVLGRADFFLRYEGVKEVELTAEGIAEYYVMNEPDGWKATIDGTTLTVTAPTKKAIEIGAAEVEGEVLIHATTETGKCKVAKVEVKAGPGVTLSVDMEGNITVENSFYGENTNNWGEVSFGFNGVVFGLATPELFNASPEEYIGVYNSTWSAPSWDDIIFPSIYNFAPEGEYVEGEYETDIIKTTVAEAYFAMTYTDIQPGAHYVIWAAPSDAEGRAIISDAVYTEYVYAVHEVEVSSVNHSDAVISLNVVGASSYIIGYVNESMYNNEYSSATFEEYMTSAMGGPWTGFVSWGASDALGVEMTEVPAELKLSELFGEKLAYGANYKVWVMPIFDHMKKLDEANSYPEEGYYAYDYSAFDFNKNFMPYVFDVKTNEIEAGGNYAASLELESKDFTSIKVALTPSEGTETVWYAWYSVEEFATFATDEEIMNALLMDCYTPAASATTVSKTYINPGETWVLATFSVGTDGKYGKIVTGTFESAAIPYDKNITVELVSLAEDGNNYVATVKVSGASKVMGYNITANDDSRATFMTNVCKNGAKASYYGYQMAAVTDGQAVLTFEKSKYKKNYLVAAYNVTDNLVSAISEEILVIDTIVE